MKRTLLEKPGNEVPFALWGDWELAFAAQFVTCSMAAAKNPAIQGEGVVIQCCPTLSQSQGSGMFLGRGGRGHDLFTKLPFTFPLLLDCRHIRRASRNQEFMGIGASSPFASDAEKG